MNKEFVPYDIALGLKELGFDEPCIGYRKEDNIFEFFATPDRDNTNSIFQFYPTSPLYQQAFRWLRNEYFLVHDIKPVWVGRPILEKYEYTIYSHSKTGRSYVTGSGSSESIEEYQETEIVCLREILKEAKKLKNGHNIYH